jgi:uracil-DNA glycosylase
MIPGWDLQWFQSEDYQNVLRKLSDSRLNGISVSPSRTLDRMFRSLSIIDAQDVRCAIIGQDPYPNPGFATGVAFSIERSVASRDYPQTLRTILREYSSDLGYGLPASGDLTRWCSEGCLLWNAYPTCKEGSPGSHHWPEYNRLTEEIVTTLSRRGIVFAFLGAKARQFSRYVSSENNYVIETAHPSPRANRSGNPFTGSRLFSTVNARLVDNGLEPINWKLE